MIRSVRVVFFTSLMYLFYLKGLGCLGDEQSPIDVHTWETIRTEYSPLDYVNYDVKYWCMGNFTFWNTGQSVQLDIPQTPVGIFRPYIQGGGLPGKYFVHQLSWHWGDDSSKGSEHLVNGRHWAGELQILHVKENYTTVDDAIASGDTTALAILAVIIRNKGPNDNLNYDEMLSLLPFVSRKRAELVTTSISTSIVYAYQDIGLVLNDQTSIVFGVKACNDVHIALSTDFHNFNDNTYELVLGAWWDSRAMIRRCKQCAAMATTYISVLSCTEFHYFWISLANGTIKIGKGLISGEDTFIEYDDPNPYTVRYLGVSTGWCATGEWRFTHGDHMQMNGFALNNLLPSDTSRWFRYHGSLTSSPYSENVIWTVYKNKYYLSRKQLDAFRSDLFLEDGSPMVNNFRQIQPLNNRDVHRNFN